MFDPGARPIPRKPGAQRSRWANLARATLACVLAAGVATALYYRGQIDVEVFRAWLHGASALAVVTFVATYVVATVLFLPSLPFTLAGGALFGPVWGTVYNLLGATLGASAAFVVARYLASDWVAARAGVRVKRLMSGVETEGWRFVAFTRLMPIFPFNLINYAFGLTRVKLSHYIVATFVCMAPVTLAFTYIGFVGRQALSGHEESVIRNGLIALALLAVVTLLPRLVRRFRRPRRQAIKDLSPSADRR